MGALGATSVIVGALALVWMAIAAGISLIAARRFRVAEQVLHTARVHAKLLELTPARPLLIRTGDRIEIDAQLARELGLGSTVQVLADLSGTDSGLDPDDLDALKADIETARISATRVARNV